MPQYRGTPGPRSRSELLEEGIGDFEGEERRRQREERRQREGRERVRVRGKRETSKRVSSKRARWG